MQHSTTRCDTAHHVATQHSTLRHSTPRCNAAHHVATRGSLSSAVRTQGTARHQGYSGYSRAPMHSLSTDLCELAGLLLRRRLVAPDRRPQLALARVDEPHVVVLRTRAVIPRLGGYSRVLKDTQGYSVVGSTAAQTDRVQTRLCGDRRRSLDSSVPVSTREYP